MSSAICLHSLKGVRKMEKMIILTIEHKEPIFNHFRWFWIKSVYDFTQKDNVSCLNYLRGERIFTLGAYKDKGGIPTHQDISKIYL